MLKAIDNDEDRLAFLLARAVATLVARHTSERSAIRLAAAVATNITAALISRPFRRRRAVPPTRRQVLRVLLCLLMDVPPPTPTRIPRPRRRGTRVLRLLGGTARLLSFEGLLTMAAGSAGVRRVGWQAASWLLFRKFIFPIDGLVAWLLCAAVARASSRCGLLAYSAPRASAPLLLSTGVWAH